MKTLIQISFNLDIISIMFKDYEIRKIHRNPPANDDSTNKMYLNLKSG